MREIDEVQSQSPSRSFKPLLIIIIYFLIVLLCLLTQIIIKPSWKL